jgi:hypothetical protein
VDRAKTFYTDQVGFIAKHDHAVSEETRFVELTPPGSATVGRQPIIELLDRLVLEA